MLTVSVLQPVLLPYSARHNPCLNDHLKMVNVKRIALRIGLVSLLVAIPATCALIQIGRIEEGMKGVAARVAQLNDESKRHSTSRPVLYGESLPGEA
jgi:hypothetical protein